jgi:hypothetical protein
MFRTKNGGAVGFRTDTGERTRSINVFREPIEQGKLRQARRLVEESQRSYVQEMHQLFDAIRIPTLLFYISFQDPPRMALNIRGKLNEVFPHFVTAQVLKEIKPRATAFSSLVSREGIPQRLTDDNGQVVKTNVYYPSPEMHDLAADQLTPMIKSLLG